MAKCRFCATWDKKPSEWKVGEVLLIGATYTIVGDGGEHRCVLNFCPICGKELVRRVNDENEE